MTVRTALAPQRAAVGDPLNHWTECHNDDRALCGLDVSDEPFVDFDQASCIVCEDLVDQPCGCPPGCWCTCSERGRS